MYGCLTYNRTANLSATLAPIGLTSPPFPSWVSCLLFSFESSFLHTLPSLRDALLLFSSLPKLHLLYDLSSTVESPLDSTSAGQNLNSSTSFPWTIRYVADFYGPEGKDRLDAIFHPGWDSYTSPTTRTFVLFRDSCANYSFRVTASMRNRKFVCKTKFRLWKETICMSPVYYIVQ